MSLQHVEMTGEQAVALSRLVLKRLSDGGQEPLQHARKLHSWSNLILNIDPIAPTRDLLVSTPLLEKGPSIAWRINPDGKTEKER